MEKFSSIMFQSCSKISNDEKIVGAIKEKYGLKLVDYPWERRTIIEPVNSSGNGLGLDLVDSNLSFIETIEWAKGIFEGIDIFKDDPSKFIMLNGWEYNDLPGRSYLEMKDSKPKEATVDIIDDFNVESMEPIVGGVSVPFLGIAYKEIEPIGCKNVNVLTDGSEIISFRNGLTISVSYTSLTKYQMLNWIKHLVFEGVNIYPDKEIVVENYDEDFDKLLKDCIPLYKFKENLLSK